MTFSDKDVTGVEEDSISGDPLITDDEPEEAYIAAIEESK
jgi:hypothetical protein